MSDKKSCPVCGGDLEFEADTYCGGTCADIAEMRRGDDERIAELERELTSCRETHEQVYETQKAFHDLAVKERNAAWQEVHALKAESEKLRSLLRSGFAYVRDANRLMAADGDLDEEDEDGANEWLEKAAAALT